jgi:hypothetical protein
MTRAQQEYQQRPDEIDLLLERERPEMGNSCLKDIRKASLYR